APPDRRPAGAEGGRIMSSASAPAAGSGDKPATPKSKWDTILTATPVALTVVATLFAGLSSSEMTQAQYHRSLAAQHQSKVRDEWNFFQAKKVRGQSMEQQAALLRAMTLAAPLDEKELRVSAQRLVDGLDRAEREAKRLQGLAGRGGPGATGKGPSAPTL